MASRKSGKPASAKPAQPAAPKYLDIKRGVENWTQASEWLRVRGIEDIECITPDFAGVARGKMMPSSKFTSNTSLSLPSAVFRHTISGEYPEETGDFRYDPLDGDLKLMPDLSTLSVVPWETDPTAQVICDMVTTKGDPVSYTPRNVLKKVVELYTERGWKPVVAPEIEFYLVAQSDDPDYPLKPPRGPLGPDDHRRAVLLDRRRQRVRRAGRRHLRFLRQAGAGDRHADPRGRPGAAGDQPAPRRPGGACRPGVPVQAHDPRGGDQARHVRHLHGQADAAICRIGDAYPPVGGRRQDRQEHLLQARRRAERGVLQLHRRHAALRAQGAGDDGALCQFLPAADAGHGLPGQQCLGLRQPHHRVPGAAFRTGGAAGGKPAAVIGRQFLPGAGGVAGLRLSRHGQWLVPSDPAYKTVNEGSVDLPRGLLEAVSLLESEPGFAQVFGQEFINTYAGVKRGEFETFMQVISPWEREFLLLNV
jgi:hypothetical protein